MFICNIKTWNFRAFKHLFYSFSPGINIICGDNATGKTSIIESIYVLCLTKSHRSKKDAEMIKFDSDYLVVKGDFQFNIKKAVLQLSISNKGKLAKLNGKESKNLSNYIGYANVVLFCPEDLMIIKGSPSDRRKFIDVEMGQISQLYLKDLIEYKELIKQRNALLKDIQNDRNNKSLFSVLDVIDEKIVETGSKIISSRQKFIELITEISSKNMHAISSNVESLKIEYIPTTLQSEYKTNLLNYRETDIMKGSTSIGPHRDDILIKINDLDVSLFGSQGQQRSVVLSLKLSLVELISRFKKEMPILLLDDVFSELDDKRQNEIMKLINKGIQTFITTTSIGEIDKNIIANAKIFNLNKDKGVEHER